MKQRSPEWFKARENRLTASMFGTAAGINKYMSRAKYYRQIIGEEEKFAGNEATDWGELHEPTACMDYEAETGNLVKEVGFFPHPEMDWLGCSPDGLVGNGLIEIKCPFTQKIYDGVPPQYMAQMQGQMEICDRDWCDFWVWTPDATGLIRVLRSDEYWEWMLPLLEEFWAHVQSRESPKRRKRPTPPDVICELRTEDIVNG